MSKPFSTHKCYFHPNQMIVKFCINPLCTLPLCQKCVPIHEQQHIEQQKTILKAQILQYQKASQTALQKIQSILTIRKQQKKIVYKKLKQLKQEVIEQINKQFKQVQDELNFQQMEQLEEKWNKIRRGSIKNLIYFYSGDYDHYFKTDFESNFQQKIMKSMVQLFTKIKNFIADLQTNKNMKGISKQKQDSQQLKGHLNQTQQGKKIYNNFIIDQDNNKRNKKSQNQRYFSGSTSKLLVKHKKTNNYNQKLTRQKQNCMSLLDLRQGSYLNDLNTQQFTFKKKILQIKQSNKSPTLDHLNVQLLKPNNQIPQASKRNSIFNTLKTQNRTALKSALNIQNIRSKYLNINQHSKDQKYNPSEEADQIKKSRIMSNQQIRKSIEARIKRRHEFTSSPQMKNDGIQNFSSIKRQNSLQNQKLNEQNSFHEKRKHFQQFNLDQNHRYKQKDVTISQKKGDLGQGLNNSKANSRFKKYDYLKQLSSNLQNSNVIKTYEFK